MSDCLFCKIIAGDIPSSKVYEDDLCYAFNDIAPQAPTHFLVIPKAHIGSVSEVNGDNSAVVAHIFEVVAKLAKEKGMDSYRVVSNIGEQAGQSVFHLHFHVLSGRDMTWPPGGCADALKRGGDASPPLVSHTPVMPRHWRARPKGAQVVEFSAGICPAENDFNVKTAPRFEALFFCVFRYAAKGRWSWTRSHCPRSHPLGAAEPHQHDGGFGAGGARSAAMS